MKTGVYQIRNLINGKCYIGSAASRGGMYKRRDKHYSDLRQQRHHSKHLQLENVKEIRERLGCGVTQQQLAEEFNVSRQTIGDIKNGRIWNI